MTTMPISLEDEKQLWRAMPNSPFQALIHNELLKTIEEDRMSLEHCTADEVLLIQARLSARKALLGFIHRNDGTHQPN